MSLSYPKISIVTPNYNGETFLEETILSVINQNYPNLEYIIIDGGSTDSSLKIIKKYERYLKYWISEADEGMYEAIQKGFNYSTGDIMAWINSDDMYHKNSFFTVAEIFNNLKNVNWLTGKNTNYDELGRTFNARSSYSHNKYSQFFEPSKHIQQESTFWRRSLWDKIGSTLNTSLKYAGDFDLWIRFNRHDQIYITDALIGGFRIRKNQLTQLFMDKYNEECYRILQNERESFSFYEHNIYHEIKSLKTELNFSEIDEIKKTTLKNKIKFLSKENNKIIFNLEKQNYELKDTSMKSILSTITKRRNNMGDFLEMIKLEHSYYPEVILDVGVANGTSELYNTFPQSHFILFEALKEFIPDMQKHKQNINNMDIEVCALGSKNGTIDINVHPDLVGSSIYLENEDSNVNGDKRTIDMKTLDSFKEQYGLLNKSILLKIDVQGAEIDVLDGAKEIFNNIDVLILEISLFDFFDNKLEFVDIINYMDRKGFVVYDIFSFSNRPLDSALAQVDIAFVKRESLFRTKHIFATKEQRSKLNDEIKQNTSTSKYKKISSKLNYEFSKQFNIFHTKLQHLKMSNEQYVIYGAGTISNFIFSVIKDNIVTKIDKKSSLIDKNILQDEVYNPKNINHIRYDKIIISVLGREEEIMNYLTTELNVNIDQIITFNI